MVYGLGVDIAEISRFQRFLDEGKETLIRRIFTPGEIDYCRRKKRSAQHFALRFAAKEAFLKAAGLGLREGMTWHDMEIVNNELGKPDLVLHGRAAEIFAREALSRSLTSLSHDGAYAVAVVVLEK